MNPFRRKYLTRILDLNHRFLGAVLSGTTREDFGVWLCGLQTLSHLLESDKKDGKISENVNKGGIISHHLALHVLGLEETCNSCCGLRPGQWTGAALIIVFTKTIGRTCAWAKIPPDLFSLEKRIIFFLVT